MAELRVRAVVKDKNGKSVNQYVKTKSTSARRAAYDRQIAKKNVTEVAAK